MNNTSVAQFRHKAFHDRRTHISNHAETFEKVYWRRQWGEGCGSGSRPSTTTEYRRLLRALLKQWSVRRVVDLGCGDWEFSCLVDWTGIEYLGIDVVAAIIESNIVKYSSPTIQFECADIRSISIPAADLLIIKDVLQHWPIVEIQQFLTRMRGQRMLITNTHRIGFRPGNYDISAGRFRPLSLLAFPFNVRGAQVVLEYATHLDNEQKQVLLVDEGNCNEAVSVDCL